MGRHTDGSENRAVCGKLAEYGSAACIIAMPARETNASQDRRTLGPMAEKIIPPPKRNLRVVKWLGSTPAVVVCTLCGREFKAPMSALGRAQDAQASLQALFDRHKCQLEGAS